ncbi:FAD-binding oxidoreductase [Azospirillum halopraeferens]|uniref:FAD-binding oxidoreductase n=1 Tax=Azospirillum halopraeferens TaxID=34010 RepID=UPI0003F8AD32|nr:FAD-binding oxidoreductase [Azospirillum halopraeferens]
MSRWKTIALPGWGRRDRAPQTAARPERVAEVRAAVADGVAAAGGVLARGRGRSYGDQAVNGTGRLILMERLDRILSFDEGTGIAVCEAGVTFADLMRVFLPKGWLVPVTPGTAFATLGGAVANDVHGKNHDRVGSFGDHTAWLRLLLPSGETLRAAPDENPDVFAATIGGCGLTGVILEVAVRLVRTPSRTMRVAERRIRDLDDFFAAFVAARDTATHSVGWIDALAQGGAMGRGILETGEIADHDPAPPVPPRPRRVPVEFPGFALTPLSVGLFNAVYRRRVPEGGRERAVPMERFFYPLDSLLDWNRIYGRRGFHQFQCVIPDADARAGVGRLLEAISAARAASFLAVLKTLGGEGRGMLSFPMRGYTLALDLPHGSGIPDLLARLERITLDHGGRIYLAKDSALSADGFAAMHPRLGDFRAVLSRLDPDGRLSSDMARRLRIREDAA